MNHSRAGTTRKVHRAVYLLKRRAALAEIVPSTPSLYQLAVTVPGADEAHLLVASQRSTPPSWVSLFSDQTLVGGDRKKLNDLITASTSAVLIVRIGKTSFALPFGFGRHLLDTSVLDETFGLRVVLNAVGSDTLKSIDRASLEVTGHRTREQAPRSSSISDFGIDFDQDLVQAVTGQPLDPALGRTISGSEALSVALPNDSQKLADPLKALKVWADKTDYRKKFPWVDKVREIQDSSIIAKLDTDVIDRLRARHVDKIWLAPPEILTWSAAPLFRYRGFGNKKKYDDIYMDEFLQVCSTVATLTLDQLKKWHVEQLDAEDHVQRDWPLYRCLYAEAVLTGDTYILNAGRWFRVETDFVGAVNAEVEPYLKGAHAIVSLPDYNHASEGAYNTAVAAADRRYAHMDRKNIWYGGKQSQIEVCDLFFSKKLIHVKRYSGSATLSHLFSQGTVSAQAIVGDPAFRKEFNKRLANPHKLADSQARIDAREWAVVYAVVSKHISKHTGHLDLPFFSRVTLRNAARTLGAMGYEVGLVAVRDLRP